MKPIRAILVALLGLFLFVSCAALSPPDAEYTHVEEVPPATCTSSHVETFNATEWVIPAERAALEGAMREWFDLSKGQIDLRITLRRDG